MSSADLAEFPAVWCWVRALDAGILAGDGESTPTAGWTGACAHPLQGQEAA